MCESSAQKLKAHFRRCQARREQGSWDNARAGKHIIHHAEILSSHSSSTDLDAFVSGGGSPEHATKERIKLDCAETSAVQIDPSGNETCLTPVVDQRRSENLYVVKEVGSRGHGSFATRHIHRGDMILAEKPIFSLGKDYYTPMDFMIAIRRISPSNLVLFLSLKDSCPQWGNVLLGISNTNAFPSGRICVEASRFNHSCRPNARYSWHEASGRLRIFALSHIAPDEEIYVMYIQGRDVYGTSRDARRRNIQSKFHFVCTCTACSLKGDELRASDLRRQLLGMTWARLPLLDIVSEAEMMLKDVVDAIGLLRKEGYAADADDFATDAAAFCAMHSDWESAKYWSKVAYDSRVAEFGADHPHAQRSKRAYNNPKSRQLHHPQAGQLSGRKFTAIRLP